MVDGPGPLAAALARAGAAVVQLRMKAAGAGEMLDAARELRRSLPDTPLVVNDRIDVALASGADGVHHDMALVPLHARGEGFLLLDREQVDVAVVRVLRVDDPLAVGGPAAVVDMPPPLAAGDAFELTERPR